MSPNLAASSGKAKIRTKAVVFSLLALCLMVLAACGQGGSAQAPSTAKNSVLNIVPSPKGDFTNGFTPFSSTANYGAQGMIYETLLFFNRMNGDVKPWLAQSYSFSSNAKTLTFHLRTDVKWSDGQAFTSADVVFTLDELKQYPAADTNGLWQYLQGVQATDSSTVVVTLSSPTHPCSGTWPVRRILSPNTSTPVWAIRVNLSIPIPSALAPLCSNRSRLS